MTSKKGGECVPGCDMRGMLGFLILFLLSKKPMHGQELADEIGKRRGGEKPSPGTIYPALKTLKEAGWIVEKNTKGGKSIVYALSEDGRITLKMAKQRFCQIFVDVME